MRRMGEMNKVLKSLSVVVETGRRSQNEEIEGGEFIVCFSEQKAQRKAKREYNLFG